MKKNKSKLILPSILTIIGCIALGTGSTYSLFTSESTNNITISSGKVNVTSTLSNLKTSSKESVSGDYIDQVNGSFYLGGKASIDGSSLNIENIAPGDKVEFDINIKNEGNISTQYQYSYSLDSDASLSAKKLLANFNVTSKINDTDKELIGTNHKYISYSSGYSILEINDTKTIHFVFELPIELSDTELMGVTDLKLNFKVEAIQGNASVSSEESYTLYKEEKISNANELANVLSNKTSDEVIDVTLTQDVTLSSTLNTTNNDVILDLNGNTLKGSSSSIALNTSGKGEVEISNGKIEGTPESNHALIHVYDASKLTLNNVEAYCESGNALSLKTGEIEINGGYLKSKSAFGIATNGADTTSGTITINDATIESGSVAIFLPGQAKTILNNCTVNGYTVICGGDTTINGGNIY